MKNQGEGAEHHDDRKRYPEHGLGLLPFQKDDRHLNDGRNDRDRRGSENWRLLRVERAPQNGLKPCGKRIGVRLPQLEGGEKENDGEEVEKKFHGMRRPKGRQGPKDEGILRRSL